MGRLGALPRHGEANVAILTGTGDAFCAGADLKEYIPPVLQSGPRQVLDNVKTGLGGLTRGCTGSRSR
ncbi:MAG: hypothetical protein WD844_10570 [Thermoleophilaceae bacterium]